MKSEICVTGQKTQAFRSHIHRRNQNDISQPLENNFKRRKYRLGNNRQNIKVVGAKVRESEIIQNIKGNF